MWITVEGIYAHGTIELVERPPSDIQRSRVLVTFLEAPARAPRQPMVFGRFAGARVSTEEDFRIAEWRGDALDDDGDQARR